MESARGDHLSEEPDEEESLRGVVEGRELAGEYGRCRIFLQLRSDCISRNRDVSLNMQ